MVTGLPYSLFNNVVAMPANTSSKTSYKRAIPITDKSGCFEIKSFKLLITYEIILTK
jgi:hypothetical protein